MHPSRDQGQPPGWSDQLKRAFHLRDPWSRSKKVLLGSILSSLLAIAASLADFGSLFQMWRTWGASNELSSEELQHEEENRPPDTSPKTPEETQKATLDSLDLKHKDSRVCLEMILRLRESKEPKDVKLARACLVRVIQDEKPTASEGLLSYLSALQNDLLVRDRETGRANSSTDIASNLSPDKTEAAERLYERRLYRDDPVYKGFKDPPSTLNSLDLKHRDSRPCLDLVLRLRDSKESRDREIAHSCIERVIQNERPTASDELLSQLYTLRGDLLISDGESAKAILELETASRLSPGSVETAILLLRAYKAEGHKLRTPPPWSEDLQRRIHELDGKIDTLEDKLQGNELRGRSAGVFIGIEKFSGFNLADISVAVNDVTPESTSKLAPSPLTSYWKDPPCQASSVPAFASGTCGLGGNGQVVATSRTALDTSYWELRYTGDIGSNLVSSSQEWVRVVPYDHIAARDLYNTADIDSQKHATYTQSRIDGKIEVATRVNGPITVTTGRDAKLNVGSFRVAESQVMGPVEIDTRINGAIGLSTSWRGISLGDVSIRTGSPSIQRVNGSIIAAAGRDLELNVGSSRVEESQFTGSVKMDTRLNGIIGASTSSGDISVGDVSIRTGSPSIQRVNGSIIAADGRDLELNVGSFRVAESQVTGSVTMDTRLNGIIGALTSSGGISVGDVSIRTASPSVQLQDHNPVEKVLAVGVNGAGAASLDPLQHAAEDAQSVSAALRDLGFRSTVLVNEAATQTKILAELWRLVQDSQPADMLIFYFSGHGFTDVNGHPVLVTGGNLDGVLETLSLEELDYVLSFHRGQAIILLDTCLNETQFDSGTYQRSIAGPSRPIFIVAGAPGSRAIESPRLGSGIFTYTLLRFLKQQLSRPELNFDELYRYTATETSRLARTLYGEDQRPQQLVLR